MAESSYVRQRTEGLARSPSLSALLILADISGYTRFMIASQDAMVHGQAAITMLLEAVIDAVQPPLIVHELEGDAVFVYAERGPESAEACREAVLAWMWRAFAAFRHRQAEIVEATFCPCAVCRNAEKLRLKLLVHSGSVLRHETGGWPEISGVDVILTHRLAKNRVATSEYILMTEPAVRDLSPGPEFDLVPRIEHPDGFGPTRVLVHDMRDDGRAFDAARRRLYDGAWPGVAARSVLGVWRSVLRSVRESRHPELRSRLSELDDPWGPPSLGWLWRKGFLGTGYLLVSTLRSLGRVRRRRRELERRAD